MFKSHRVSCCPLSPTVGMFATFFGSDMWHLPSGLIKFCLISHLIQYILSFVSRINSSRHCGVVWWNSVNVLKFTDDKITLDRRWILFDGSKMLFISQKQVSHILDVSRQFCLSAICVQHRCFIVDICNTVHTVKGQEEQSGKSSTIRMWVRQSNLTAWDSFSFTRFPDPVTTEHWRHASALNRLQHVQSDLCS